jgi:hypothetical protein
MPSYLNMDRRAEYVNPQFQGSVVGPGKSNVAVIDIQTLFEARCIRREWIRRQ